MYDELSLWLWRGLCTYLSYQPTWGSDIIAARFLKSMYSSVNWKEDRIPSQISFWSTLYATHSLLHVNVLTIYHLSVLRMMKNSICVLREFTGSGLNPALRTDPSPSVCGQRWACHETDDDDGFTLRSSHLDNYKDQQGPASIHGPCHL